MSRPSRLSRRCRSGTQFFLILRARARTETLTRSSSTRSNALKYSNPGGSPDIAGSWMGVGGAFSSFEFPTGSFRTWVSPTKGLIIEQARYESWECTDVVGQSLIEMTHVEILLNGTAITDTQCLLLTVSEDLQTSNQVYFSCDEEPAPDSFGYTNSRLSSTVVLGPSSLTCNGSPVTLDTAAAGGPAYGGPGSSAQESTDLGVMFPPFESVNVNGIPDYTGAGGNPFSQGMYYRDIPTQDGFSINVGYNNLKPGAFQSTMRAFATPNGVVMFQAFLSFTGSEKVSGEVYNTSGVSRRLNTDGTLSNAVPFCSVVDFTDPFAPLYTESSTPGECPAPTDVPFSVSRLLAFPPQFDIEDTTANIPAARGLFLAGAKDFQPGEGVDSDITTSGLFFMNKPNAQGWITFDLDVKNANPLSGSGGFTMGHIHAGDSSTVDGPVVVHLIPTLENWPTPTSPVPDSGDPPLSVLDPPLNIDDTEFVGAFSAAQFVGPLEGKTMDEFVALVRESDENFYVNIHTTDYPGGAIRAQLSTKVKPFPSRSRPIGAALAAGGIVALLSAIANNSTQTAI